MDSQDLARYIEANDGITKPWLLIQLRLAKLKERRSTISAEEYARELADLQQDLIQLGQWWNGQEDQVFRQGL
jgi:polyphosphate kinase 2 (PPK2 family)